MEFCSSWLIGCWQLLINCHCAPATQTVIGDAHGPRSFFNVIRFCIGYVGCGITRAQAHASLLCWLQTFPSYLKQDGGGGANADIILSFGPIRLEICSFTIHICSICLQFSISVYHHSMLQRNSQFSRCTSVCCQSKSLF